jgi:hypothetical protein
VAGGWIRITYTPILTETIGNDVAECPVSHPVDIATLNGQAYPPKVSFAAGDTLDTWFTRNLIAQRNGQFKSFLVPGTGEEFVEFVEDVSVRGTMDRRFRGATAQFVAAGSFGLLHTTLQEWHWSPAKTSYLNKVFDLSQANGRCLQELRPPSQTLRPDDPRVRAANKEALRLGVAIHDYNAASVNYQCVAYPCDQIDWQRRWAQIVKKYNTNGKGYTLSAEGVNEIVRDAVSKFDAK